MKASEIIKINPVTEETRQKLRAHMKQLEVLRVIQSFENCALCAAPIEFQYRTDSLRNKVMEQGHCSHCRQAIPARTFSLS
jgi:hypothetical protein